MLRAVADRDLDTLLAQVSRSFYLSLAILPGAVRTQLSIAYLVARAADTIADTEAVAGSRRLELLRKLRAHVAGDPTPLEIADLAAEVRGEIVVHATGPTSGERVILERLGDCLTRLSLFSLGDRRRTRRVLDHLIAGMERDLERFDGHTLVALGSLDELDRHCYLAAGCVGEYWTEMTAAHLPVVTHLAAPDMVERGVRLGKALQLVNVLRDAPRDLAGGRCYLPSSLLARHGLVPADLKDPDKRHLALPVLDALREIALGHVDAAWGYVMAIPARAPRLRLACIWPLWIGLATLARLAAARDPLDPTETQKIPRREVYRIVAESSASVSLDPVLVRLHRRRRAQAA